MFQLFIISVKFDCLICSRCDNDWTNVVFLKSIIKFVSGRLVKKGSTKINVFVNLIEKFQQKLLLLLICLNSY